MTRKIIDISHKLTNEKPQIKISDDLTLTVNDSKNNVLGIMTSMNNTGDKTEEEFIDTLLIKLFGEEGKGEIRRN